MKLQEIISIVPESVTLINITEQVNCIFHFVKNQLLSNKDTSLKK